MKKAGPGVEDILFKNVERTGEIYYACVTGYFTGETSSPTDLFIVGATDEKRLEAYAHHIETQIGKEISYTPMTLNEYQYRLNFNDMFLQQIFTGQYKEIFNKLPADMQPEDIVNKQKKTSIVRDPA